MSEKTASGNLTEEFLCAQYLDNLDEVEFWIRNLPNKPGAVRFQTPTGSFYPDFVCKLKDGRIAVIEYKGGDRISNEDSKTKLAIGTAWQDRSKGRCLFLMPTNRDFPSIREAFKAH